MISNHFRWFLSLCRCIQNHVGSPSARFQIFFDHLSIMVQATLNDTHVASFNPYRNLLTPHPPMCVCQSEPSKLNTTETWCISTCSTGPDQEVVRLVVRILGLKWMLACEVVDSRADLKALQRLPLSNQHYDSRLICRVHLPFTFHWICVRRIHPTYIM